MEKQEQTEQTAEDYGFIKNYFSDLTPETFESADSQRDVWMRFADMLCMVLLVQKEKHYPSALGRIGCLLSDEDLMAALEPHDKLSFPYRARIRKIFDTLIKKGEVDKKGEVLSYWQFLSAGRLLPVEQMAFLLAVCAAQNRKYGQIFGILQGERENAAKLTVGLVHDFCSLFLSDEENQSEILFDEDSFFNVYLLEKEKKPQKPTTSVLERPLSLRREVLEVLAGNTISLGGLSRCAQAYPYAFTAGVDESKGGEDSLPEIISHADVFSRMASIYAGMSVQNEPGIIHLTGTKGSGRSFLVRSLGVVVFSDVVHIRTGKLLTFPMDDIEEMLQTAVCKSVFEHAFVYLEVEGENEGQWPVLQHIFSFLQSRLKILFVGSQKPLSEQIETEGVVAELSVDLPSAAEQKRFWTFFAEQNRAILKNVDLTELVSKYDLTPGRILDTITRAVMTEPLDDDDMAIIEQDFLEKEIRLGCHVEFGEYASRLESRFTWEDLELHSESKKLMEDAINRVRYRSTVNEEFGFGKKLPYGKGTSLLFYGPPGTGKTMAAQVMANELGLDIYRIDLSQIGSKYIGETEKNLGAVFEAARFSNAILFFDEADALFTKRTDVSSSNDRYANAQTAYLLQKIEEYTGVSVLATNATQNFDSAFKRRMTFMIPIEQPDEKTRLALWEKVFPPETPFAEEIHFPVFARLAELTGSGIKSAAVAAAYTAASNHRGVSNRDIISAIDMVCRQLGRPGVGKEIYASLYTDMGKDRATPF